MESRKTVSERIKEYREKVLHLTQAEFAVALGLEEKKGRSTVNNWEQGAVQIKSDDLTNISSTFGVSVDYLLGITNCPSLEESTKIACKVTGLTENALNNIKMCAEYNPSALFESEKFVPLMADIECLYASELLLGACLEKESKTPKEKESSLNEMRRQYGEGGDIEAFIHEMKKDLENIYNFVRLQKYELRDSFSALVESIAPSDELLTSAKSILRAQGGLSSSGRNED